MKVKTNNIVELTPLNPNVSLGKDDFLQRAMFPVDDKLHTLVHSDEFKQLLLTDASTDDGQDFLATYYGIDDWANIKQRLIIDKGVNLASRYYYLLFLVKVQSKKDNVWISFYEGLHRHASLLITLLSAVFNTTTNILKFNTLTVDYFKQHQLPNFKSVNETPHDRLKKSSNAKSLHLCSQNLFQSNVSFRTKLKECHSKALLTSLQGNFASIVNSSVI